MENLTEYKGFWFHPETCQAVKDIIVSLPRDTRIRVFYGDTKTGVSWNEENDVCGYIGRSTGTQKIPLLINNKASFGGGALLNHCIVAIVTTAGNWLYKHEKFNTGNWFLKGNTIHSSTEYPFTVFHNGTLQANFKTEKQAQNYIAFMRGERFCK